MNSIENIEKTRSRRLIRKKKQVSKNTTEDISSINIEPEISSHEKSTDNKVPKRRRLTRHASRRLAEMDSIFLENFPSPIPRIGHTNRRLRHVNSLKCDESTYSGFLDNNSYDLNRESTRILEKNDDKEQKDVNDEEEHEDEDEAMRVNRKAFKNQSTNTTIDRPETYLVHTQTKGTIITPKILRSSQQKSKTDINIQVQMTPETSKSDINVEKSLTNEISTQSQTVMEDVNKSNNTPLIITPQILRSTSNRNLTFDPKGKNTEEKNKSTSLNEDRNSTLRLPHSGINVSQDFEVENSQKPDEKEDNNKSSRVLRSRTTQKENSGVYINPNSVRSHRGKTLKNSTHISLSGVNSVKGNNSIVKTLHFSNISQESFPNDHERKEDSQEPVLENSCNSRKNQKKKKSGKDPFYETENEELELEKVNENRSLSHRNESFGKINQEEEEKYEEEYNNNNNNQSNDSARGSYLSSEFPNSQESSLKSEFSKRMNEKKTTSSSSSFKKSFPIIFKPKYVSKKLKRNRPVSKSMFSDAETLATFESFSFLPLNKDGKKAVLQASKDFMSEIMSRLHFPFQLVHIKKLLQDLGLIPIHDPYNYNLYQKIREVSDYETQMELIPMDNWNEGGTTMPMDIWDVEKRYLEDSVNLSVAFVKSKRRKRKV